MRDWLHVRCENGHDWRSIGGCNAGCHEDLCSCSIPVHVCNRCGDCDYGYNVEANQIRADCAAVWGDPRERFTDTLADGEHLQEDR